MTRGVGVAGGSSELAATAATATDAAADAAGDGGSGGLDKAPWSSTLARGCSGATSAAAAWGGAAALGKGCRGGTPRRRPSPASAPSHPPGMPPPLSPPAALGLRLEQRMQLQREKETTRRSPTQRQQEHEREPAEEPREQPLEQPRERRQEPRGGGAEEAAEGAAGGPGNAGGSKPAAGDGAAAAAPAPSDNDGGDFDVRRRLTGLAFPPGWQDAVEEERPAVETPRWEWIENDEDRVAKSQKKGRRSPRVPADVGRRSPTVTAVPLPPAWAAPEKALGCPRLDSEDEVDLQPEDVFGAGVPAKGEGVIAASWWCRCAEQKITISDCAPTWRSWPSLLQL